MRERGGENRDGDKEGGKDNERGHKGKRERGVRWKEGKRILLDCSYIHVHVAKHCQTG